MHMPRWLGWVGGLFIWLCIGLVIFFIVYMVKTKGGDQPFTKTVSQQQKQNGGTHDVVKPPSEKEGFLGFDQSKCWTTCHQLFPNDESEREKCTNQCFYEKVKGQDWFYYTAPSSKQLPKQVYPWMVPTSYLEQHKDFFNNWQGGLPFLR